MAIDFVLYVVPVQARPRGAENAVGNIRETSSSLGRSLCHRGPRHPHRTRPGHRADGDWRRAAALCRMRLLLGVRGQRPGPAISGPPAFPSARMRGDVEGSPSRAMRGRLNNVVVAPSAQLTKFPVLTRDWRVQTRADVRPRASSFNGGAVVGRPGASYGSTDIGMAECRETKMQEPKTGSVRVSGWEVDWYRILKSDRHNPKKIQKCTPARAPLTTAREHTFQSRPVKD